jgi:hypothetical protein
MKWLVLPLFLASVLLGLGVASASAAASTTTTIFHVEVSFSQTDTCGFQFDEHLQGSFKDTEFFDRSGALVKLIETNTGGRSRSRSPTPQTARLRGCSHKRRSQS